MPSPWMNKPGPLGQFMRETLEEVEGVVKRRLGELGRKAEAATGAAGEAKRDLRLARAAIKAIETASEETTKDFNERFGLLVERVDRLEESGDAEGDNHDGLDEHVAEIERRLTALESKPKPRTSARKAKTTEKAAS